MKNRKRIAKKTGCFCCKDKINLKQIAPAFIGRNIGIEKPICRQCARVILLVLGVYP